MFLDRHEELLERILIGLPMAALGISFMWPDAWPFLAVAAIVASLPIAASALRGILDRALIGDQFNFIALVLCFIGGEWQTGAIITILLGFGKMAEQRAEEHPTSPKSISEDGIVIQGTAHVDESPITGVTSLQEKIVGDVVMAGTIIRAGDIKLRALRTPEDSVPARSLAILSSERSASSTERAAERLSGLTMLLMGLGGIASWVLFRHWPGMISFFLLAGSETIGPSVKRIMHTALLSALRLGAVVKGGRALDTIATLDTLALDKASLLTYADLQIGRLEHDPRMSEPLVWECVAVAEKRSAHPVGRALFRAATKQIGAITDPDVFQIFPSKGVRAVLQEREVLVGTAELLRERNISFDGEWLVGSTSPIEGTGIDIFIALDGSCIGRVRLQDRPRTEIHESLERLRELGIKKQILFTADTVRVAGSLAHTIGVTDFRPATNAEETWREIGKLTQQGTVGYLGSGDRDVSALLRAELGMVFGNGGNGLHVESAGLTFLTDDLTHLPNLVRLARRTRLTIRWNLWFWGVTNVVGIVMVLVGLGPLWIVLYGLFLKQLPLLVAFKLARP